MPSSLICWGGFFKFDIERETFIFELQCFDARKTADSHLHCYKLKSMGIKELMNIPQSLV